MQWRTKLLLLAVAIGGCTSETGAAGNADSYPAETEGVRPVTLELPIPRAGFQVESRPLRIEAGDDVRVCEVVLVPGEPDALYPVDRIEAAIGPDGRDLLVAAAVPHSDTAAIMEAGDRVPCNRAGEAFGEALEGLVSSQHAYLDQRYPEGVGNLLHGAQPLVLEYHYRNDSEEPIAAKVKVNFHLTSAANVRHEAQLASLDNLTIYTPPGGDSTHLGECGVGDSVRLSELVRRTRAFGTDFRVWLVGGERDGELLWHSADHRDHQYEFEVPLPLEPGQRLRFECSYHNTSNAELRFGTTAEDEICSLQATYWRDDLAGESDPEPTSSGAVADQDPELDPGDSGAGQPAGAQVDPAAVPTANGRSPLGCLLLSVDEDGIARSE